jgi:organic hydroperoxide reductase OsmC/OhrA
MAPLDKVQYTAKVHTIGGRDGGSSCSSDGRLGIVLSVPSTPGTGTNPEQLLAFLASSGDSYITGIELAVDGGLTQL